MKKAGRWALAACALHLWAACSDGSGAGASLSENPAPGEVVQAEDPRRDPQRLLCASCDPHEIEGGETGDFGGERACDATVREVARDFEGSGLSAAAAVQLVEGSASVPGRYGPSRGTDFWVHADEVSGYTPNPVVDVTVEVTAVLLIEEETPAATPDLECGAKRLLFQARAHVSTSDGALSGTFEGWAGVDTNSEATFVASSDAAGFTGSLDFGSSHTPPVTQLAASLYLYLRPEGMRGTLDFTVFTDGMPYGALALDWPATDTCEVSETPVTAEEYLPVLAAARQMLGEIHPTSAQWAAPDAFRSDGPLDEPVPAGIATDVTLELDGPVTAVCRARGGALNAPSDSYSFDTTAHVSTSDGRISGSLPGVLGMTLDASGAVSHYAFDSTQVFRAEELESKLGVHGADLMGSACGMLFFRDGLDVLNQEARGALEIAARSCDGDEFRPSQLVDFLSWCSGPCEYPASPIFKRPPP